jgi:hypothetical protein
MLLVVMLPISTHAVQCTYSAVAYLVGCGCCSCSCVLSDGSYYSVQVVLCIGYQSNNEHAASPCAGWQSCGYG